MNKYLLLYTHLLGDCIVAPTGRVESKLLVQKACRFKLQSFFIFLIFYSPKEVFQFIGWALAPPHNQLKMLCSAGYNKPVG